MTKAEATGGFAGAIGDIQQATGQVVTAIDGISAIIGELGVILTAIAAAAEEQGVANPGSGHGGQSVRQAAFLSREVDQFLRGVKAA